MKTDAELIADHIATKGVTKCPTAALLPTTAAIAPDDAERHRARGDNPVPQVWKYGHGTASRHGMAKANRQRQLEEQKREREAAERAAAKERLREAREAEARQRKREREATIAAQRAARLAKVQAARAAAVERRKAARKGRAAPPRAAKAAPAFDPGPRPEMEWLPIGLLGINARYQRPVGAKHVRRLTRAFRWAHFQPLTVAPAGDRYAVIDGQHRLEAVRGLPGIDELPCYIVDAADVAGEAAAFLAINDAHRPVIALDRLRAGVVAGDPNWVALDAIVERVGLRLTRWRRAAPLTTASVATLRHCLRRHGAAALERGLVALKRAWPTESEAFAEQYIAATAHLFAAGGAELVDDRVVSELRKIDPTPFLADQIQASRGKAVTGTTLVARELFRRCLGQELER